MGLLLASAKRGAWATTTHQKHALSPTAGPLPTNARYPALAARRTGAHTELRLDPNAHPEVEIKSGGGQCQGARNVVLVELMAEVVGGDFIFEHGLVARAGHQMLPLPRGILCPDLTAVDASSGHALVIFLGSELDEGCVDVTEGNLGQV